MQCLTHVMRLILVTLLLMVAAPVSATLVNVDKDFCDGYALMAKAGSEAKQRGESKQQWQAQLQALRGYVVKNKDNVLYSVLPKVITDSELNWGKKLTPLDRYITTYNTCMADDYGKVVAAAD